MRADEITLLEAFPYAPGTETPAHIIDYRDPAKAKGQWRKPDPEIAKKYNLSPKPYRTKAPTTYVTLTKDGGVIVWFHGHENTMPWSELLDLLRRDADTGLMGEFDGIAVQGAGYVINRDRDNSKTWQGDRNRYSTDVRPIVQALLDRGVATPSMPIFLGLAGTTGGERIGTVKSLLAQPETPDRITLFHGTSSIRAEIITKEGLKPMDFEKRVWNHTSIDKKRPEHREDSVYLTASRPQAEYYAKKAVDIDRKRLGPKARSVAYSNYQSYMSPIRQMTAKLSRYNTMTDDEIAREDEHNSRYSYGRHTPIKIERELLPQWIEERKAKAKELEFVAHAPSVDKLETVILQITLTKREFAKLMADDDHLRINPDAKPEDWQHSLSHFGQVAFRGSIPPNRIKIIATGVGRVSR
jgi:hypothetical protein